MRVGRAERDQRRAQPRHGRGRSPPATRTPTRATTAPAIASATSRWPPRSARASRRSTARTARRWRSPRPAAAATIRKRRTITRDLVVSTINNGATYAEPVRATSTRATTARACRRRTSPASRRSCSRAIPALTPAQVLSIIQTTARPFPTSGTQAAAPARRARRFRAATARRRCAARACSTRARRVAAAPPPPPSPGRQIDFNADGKDDLVWRNSGSGRSRPVADERHSVRFGAAIVCPDDPNYAVTNTGDLNGDGKTDLICRKHGGLDGRWLMNGTARDIVRDPVWRSDLGWSRASPTSTATARKILSWRNTVTGQTAIWIMNGLGVHGVGRHPRPTPTWVAHAARRLQRRRQGRHPVAQHVDRCRPRSGS